MIQAEEIETLMVAARQAVAELDAALLKMNGKSRERYADAAVIAEKMAGAFNLTLADLKSESKLQHIVEARHAAMFAVRMLTRLGLKPIGQMFGRRDHTTVLHAVKTFPIRCWNDEWVKNLVVFHFPELAGHLKKS